MLKKLFSGLLSGGRDSATPKPEREAVEHKGFLIVPEPQDAGGQYRVSGWIRKPDADGGMRQRRFERSDVVPGEDACVELTVAKSQRYIDDVGDDMFEQEH
ncbi:HlyU family transcriptional regulator [Salinicola avicenniae]|uniref:HlyU family transcriptional regulator n=1 Tax=Salinicola avicenniae TaxID=2916836 RepID=UPI002073627D|nr:MULTISPECIES: HlyU family transcriptional regulator [unclassified Salinicola]